MGQGGGYSTTSNSRHFMAVSLLKMHQIFMLAFARLRVEGEVAQVLVVPQPPPLACVAHNIFWGNSCKTKPGRNAVSYDNIGFLFINFRHFSSF